MLAEIGRPKLGERLEASTHERNLQHLTSSRFEVEAMYGRILHGARKRLGARRRDRAVTAP